MKFKTSHSFLKVGGNDILFLVEEQECFALRPDRKTRASAKIIAFEAQRSLRLFVCEMAVDSYGCVGVDWVRVGGGGARQENRE